MYITRYMYIDYKATGTNYMYITRYMYIDIQGHWHSRLLPRFFLNSDFTPIWRMSFS